MENQFCRVPFSVWEALGWGGLSWRHLLGLMALGLMFRFPCVRTMLDILGPSVTGPGMSGMGLEGRALLLGGASVPQVRTSTDDRKRHLLGPKVLGGFGCYGLPFPPFLFFRAPSVHWEWLVEAVTLLLCLCVILLLLPRPAPSYCREMRWCADFFRHLTSCSPGLLMVFKVRALPKWDF